MTRAPAPRDRLGRHRVAITGLGVKTPAGLTVTAFWERILAARTTAARPVSRFDASELPVPFACEVRDYDPTDYFSAKEARRADRFTLLGFGAAVDALRDAGEPSPTDPSRGATVVGTGVGGIETLTHQLDVLRDRGPGRVSPFLVPMMMANANAGVIAMELGWTGPSVCVATACAAGSHAIGEGARLVRDGTADLVLAGGTEAAITPLTLAAFHRMGALSTHADPERASRPFDVERDGFVIGEGAAFMLLEPLERALERDAPVHALLAGYGRTSDAHHITAPPPDGEGAVACMRQALDDAGIEPDTVGHVNAHGTSTPLNDAAEARAIRKVFAAPPPVTSIKGVTGHLIGAAGAVEAVASALALRDRLVPPTANLERLGDDIDVDVVAGRPRSLAGPTPAISNSFGFGGHNASLVIAPLT